MPANHRSKGKLGDFDVWLIDLLTSTKGWKHNISTLALILADVNDCLTKTYNWVDNNNYFHVNAFCLCVGQEDEVCLGM